MYNEINPKTKKFICDALEELLEEKALSHISVTEIAEKCNISRQTFYRHFDDIYALTMWLFDSNAAGCSTYDISKDFEFSCTISFTNMLKQPKLYRQIFMNDKNNIFLDRFLRSRIDYASKHIGARYMEEDISFAVELYWSGYIHMMKKWIASGMKETPENMGKYAYKSLPTILKPYYH